MKTVRIHREKSWTLLHECPKCKNTTVSDYDNYCGKCGRKIRWVEKRD